MASEFEENLKAEASGSNNNNDAGDFECNICFELAQDPIVTLCGHLYCWPCLYRWLHHHSQSQECPVCKALIEENRLVPLYGRGKSTTDPRTRPIPGDDIPNRPSGQRPDTAPPPPGPEQNYFSNLGFGFLSGFMPMATARFGSITMSAGFGGMLPWSMMSAQFNGFPHNPMYGFPYGYQQTVHGNRVHHGHGFGPGPGPSHGFHHHHHGHGHGAVANQGQDSLVKLLLIIGFLVFAALALCDFSW